MHIQSVDQVKAIKTVKRKITDLDRSKIEAQKKAVRAGSVSYTHLDVYTRQVMDCLQKNNTQVRNMKQYLLTGLFNAPTTISNHYTSQVNHDLYGGW